MQYSSEACIRAFEPVACCYGLSQTQMQAWIADWVTTYTSLTGQTPIISTDAPFWRDCTGMWPGVSQNPLVIANADDPTCDANPMCPIPGLPGFPWSMFTFWLDRRGQRVPGITSQAATDVFQDQYEGSECKLRLFAGATQNG
jgi:hypothetical protein